MSAMRHDKRFISWLIQRNRKRRMADSTPPVTPPPAPTDDEASKE